MPLNGQRLYRFGEFPLDAEQNILLRGGKPLALAPDGGSFAYIRGEWLHDAVLIDGLK